LPVIVDHFVDFTVGSNGGEAIEHFRVLAVDGDDEVIVQFVDSDTEGEVSAEEVKGTSNDYPEEDHIEVASEHEVDIHDTDDVRKEQLEVGKHESKLSCDNLVVDV